MINNQQQYNATASQVASNFANAACQPSDPCLHAKAEELINWISQLEVNIDQIRQLLFGDGGHGKEACSENPPNWLDYKVANASSRAASLVGETSTIIRKLSGN